MLVVVCEGIIGTNRIFDPCLGPGQFEANKSRVRDQGAERAVKTTGGTAGLVIIRAGRLLLVTTFMRRGRGMRRGPYIRGCRAAILLGYRANGREINGPDEEDTKRD
jgi:hypothetical protein